MSNHGERRYLLCYDIADPKRLARVHRRVKQDGLALQYSVFDVHLAQAPLRHLVADLRGLIDPRADDVRIYGLKTDARVAWLGQPPMPEGVQLFYNSK